MKRPDKKRRVRREWGYRARKRSIVGGRDQKRSECLIRENTVFLRSAKIKKEESGGRGSIGHVREALLVAGINKKQMSDTRKSRMQSQMGTPISI